MQFFTTEQLGPHRSRTPEGYLLCMGVPLARTGFMYYAPGELRLADGSPVLPPPGHQLVTVQRKPEDVFDLRSLASYAGKPLVNDHPTKDVTPENWRELSIGVVMHPRQGTGDEADLVLADLLITDPEAIRLVELDEKVQLSAGYDADYEPLDNGELLQHNIIVNHVALVDAARCGDRCAIGDSLPTQLRKALRMKNLKDWLFRAAKCKTADEVTALEQEITKNMGMADEAELGEGAGAPGTGVHVHFHGTGAAPTMGAAASQTDIDPSAGDPNMGAGMETTAGGDLPGFAAEMMKRIEALEQLVQTALVGKAAGAGAQEPPTGDENPFAKKGDEKEDDKKTEDDETITGALQMEMPPGTDDAMLKATDSGWLAQSYQDLVARTEILLPGARLTTFDAAARPAKTVKMMCDARSEVLLTATMTDRLIPHMEALNGGKLPVVSKMTCDSVRTMFLALSDRVAQQNNRAAMADHKPSATTAVGSYFAEQGVGGGQGVHGKVRTIADLNSYARKKYAPAG